MLLVWTHGLCRYYISSTFEFILAGKPSDEQQYITLYTLVFMGSYALICNCFYKEPLHDGKISTSYRGQTKWLDQSLALTDSNW